MSILPGCNLCVGLIKFCLVFFHLVSPCCDFPVLVLVSSLNHVDFCSFWLFLFCSVFFSHCLYQERVSCVWLAKRFCIFSSSCDSRSFCWVTTSTNKIVWTLRKSRVVTIHTVFWTNVVSSTSAILHWVESNTKPNDSRVGYLCFLLIIISQFH